MSGEVVVIVASYADSLLRFRGHLIESIALAGNRIYAVAPNIDAKTKQALTKIGATPISLRLSRTGINPLTDLVTLIQLFRIFRRTKPAVVLSYTIKPVIYGSFAANLAGVPRIYALITGLGSTFIAKGAFQRLIRNTVQWMYRRTLVYCRAVIFQNPDDRSYFVTNGLSREENSLIVNGSGVDIDYFKVTALPPAAVFLLIARLIKDKGIREYAEAAESLAGKFPDTRFLLVGWFDSNPTAITSREVEDWQSRGVIEFLGRSDDVREAISQCSVYVLPSYAEGTPRTVLEAMAMGRPVITTDAPGCRETVKAGVNGILVPAGDAHALAIAMEKLARDPALRSEMGAESRLLAESKYDVHDVNRRMVEIMQVHA